MQFVLRAFRGLTTAYYLRQLFFGSLIALMYATVFIQLGDPEQDYTHVLLLLAVLALLYPYSRFVYESAAGFIVGGYRMRLPLFLSLGFKVFMMIACYAAAPFIAPIGLIYLALRRTDPA